MCSVAKKGDSRPKKEERRCRSPAWRSGTYRENSRALAQPSRLGPSGGQWPIAATAESFPTPRRGCRTSAWLLDGLRRTPCADHASWAVFRICCSADQHLPQISSSRNGIEIEVTRPRSGSREGTYHSSPAELHCEQPCPFARTHLVFDFRQKSQACDTSLRFLGIDSFTSGGEPLVDELDGVYIGRTGGRRRKRRRVSSGGAFEGGSPEGGGARERTRRCGVERKERRDETRGGEQLTRSKRCSTGERAFERAADHDAPTPRYQSSCFRSPSVVATRTPFLFAPDSRTTPWAYTRPVPVAEAQDSCRCDGMEIVIALTMPPSRVSGVLLTLSTSQAPESRPLRACWACRRVGRGYDPLDLNFSLESGSLLPALTGVCIWAPQPQSHRLTIPLALILPKCNHFQKIMCSNCSPLYWHISTRSDPSWMTLLHV